jgi:hypothetical protein
MDKNRGLMVVGGGVALLVAGWALQRWNRSRISSEQEEQARTENMITEYENYSKRPAAKKKPVQRKRQSNGRAGQTQRQAR